ncbi:hypothetical protein DKP78_24110, partial [Enterococcus faecium]
QGDAVGAGPAARREQGRLGAAVAAGGERLVLRRTHRRTRRRAGRLPPGARQDGRAAGHHLQSARPRADKFLSARPAPWDG